MPIRKIIDRSVRWALSHSNTLLILTSTTFLTILIVLWSLNAFSQSFLISFWSLLLYLIAKIATPLKLRIAQIISKEIGVFSLVYTVVTVMYAYNESTLYQKKDASTLFPADNLELINIVKANKHNPTLSLNNYAYYRYYKEWNSTGLPINSILSGLTTDNDSIQLGNTVNPSLFGFFSSKVKSYNFEHFKLLKIANLEFYLPEPKTYNLQRNNFQIEGKVCDFKITTSDRQPEAYRPQWVHEQEVINAFNSEYNIKNLKVLRVDYSLELNCPWYKMYHPAIQTHHQWFEKLALTYTKQMDWNSIRTTHIKLK